MCVLRVYTSILYRLFRKRCDKLQDVISWVIFSKNWCINVPECQLSHDNSTPLGPFAKLRRATLLASSCMSVWLYVRPPAHLSARTRGTTPFPLDEFSLEFYLRIFPKNVDYIQASLASDKNNVYFREAVCSFIIVPRWNLLRMRNILDKRCGENKSTNFMFNDIFSKNRAVLRKCGKILYNWTGHRW